jgi:hypothetical protein
MTEDEHELRVVLRAAEHGAVEMVEGELAEGGSLFSEVVYLVLLPGDVPRRARRIGPARTYLPTRCAAG